MRCNTCVQILLSLCVSCGSCPHSPEGQASSSTSDKPTAIQENLSFPLSELTLFLAHWEALAQEKEWTQLGTLPLETIEAIEAWAMQWSIRCAMPLPEAMPEAMPPAVLEAKAACWEALERASGKEASLWLYENHHHLMALWQAWLK